MMPGTDSKLWIVMRKLWDTESKERANQIRKVVKHHQHVGHSSNRRTAYSFLDSARKRHLQIRTSPPEDPSQNYWRAAKRFQVTKPMVRRRHDRVIAHDM